MREQNERFYFLPRKIFCIKKPARLFPAGHPCLKRDNSEEKNELPRNQTHFIFHSGYSWNLF